MRSTKNNLEENNMKKVLALILSVTLTASLLFSGCGKTTDSGKSTPSGDGADGKKNVVYVTSSSLGDDPLVDLVWDSVKKAGEDFGMNTKCIELNNDTSLYTSSLIDLCGSGEWDLIVTGFFQMIDPVCEAVAEYPDQHFMVFDSSLDYSTGNFNNCVSVEGLQNEGSFLAGVLAACLTTSGKDGFNDDKVIGCVMANPGMLDDFLAGYIDGAKWVDPAIEIIYSYNGSFSDTASASEHALAQFNRGADIVYSVNGAAGLGVANAALQTGHYMIGVDTDLAAEVSSNNNAMAQRIVTSVCKDFGTILYDQLEKYADGTLEFGTHTRYGLADHGMFIVENEYFDAIVDDAIKAKLKEANEAVSSGEVKVSTVIGATDEEYAAILARASAVE